MTFDQSEISRFGGRPVDLYKFVSGAQEWLYTTEKAGFTFDGDAYLGRAISHTEPNDSADNPGQIRITLPDDDALVQFFINGVPALPIQVTIFRVHRDAPTDERIMFLGEVSSDDSTLPAGTLVCDPLQGRFVLQVPRGLYQRDQCIWTLGDPDTCGLDLAPFTHTSTVSALNVLGTNWVTVAGAATFGGADPNYFKDGVLVFGEYRAMIESQVGDQVKLMQRIPSLIVTSPVSLIAGDDHHYTTCRDKFNNIARAMVFPNLPLANVWYGRGVA